LAARFPAEQIRRAALPDRPPPGLETFACRYLRANFPLPSSAFHRWLAGALDGLHGRRGTRLDVIAPRGAAKSTWSSLAYPLYAAVEGLEPYVQIFSDTRDQAWVWLDAIREELETNPGLAADYPQAAGVGPVWRKDRLRLRNGVVLEALGSGSKMRGRRNRQHRPTLIIVDDPENEDHTTSPLRRERSWRWFTRAVLNAGGPQTNVIVLGTALHRDCLVLRLTRTGGWTHRLFKALVSPPERMDLWHQWEEIYIDYENADRAAAARAFYEAHQGEMDRGAESLWPERESVYDLMGLRVTIGHAAFESEKQGSPVNPEACEWPAEYFDRPGFWFEQWPQDLVLKALALDPSKGSDAKRGDFAAYVWGGMDRHGVVYLDAELLHCDVAKLVDVGVERIGQFRPDLFAVEVNQFQSLLCAEFARVGRERKVDVPVLALDNRVHKEVRIRRLGPYLSQRRLRFKARSPGAALLVQQLKDFAVGDHDDGPDGAEMFVRALIHLQQGRASQAGGIIQLVT
jgi:hypothetical protein